MHLERGPGHCWRPSSSNRCRPFCHCLAASETDLRDVLGTLGILLEWSQIHLQTWGQGQESRYSCGVHR
eukprot:10679680-Lingulodinium_polyedra.AAC.1